MFTDEQRALIAEMGPYSLRSDGAVISTHGVALAIMRPNERSEETEWDRAVVAAINEVTRTYGHP